LYLPPENQINKAFLKQVLAEEKKLLKKSEIKPIKVSKWDELSVK